jgi:uncharacterized membrane protein
MSQVLKIFFLAMTPVGELRAAIPVGLTIFHLDWLSCYLISVAGNLVPVIFLLLFLQPISKYFSKKSKICEKFINWFFERTRKKYDSKKLKYGAGVALVIFVALPLPITGGWTGSIISFLFGIPFRIAFPLIAFGVGIAGLIVALATIFGIALSKYFCWQVIVGGIAIAIIIWLCYNKGK